MTDRSVRRRRLSRARRGENERTLAVIALGIPATLERTLASREGRLLRPALAAAGVAVQIEPAVASRSGGARLAEQIRAVRIRNGLTGAVAATGELVLGIADEASGAGEAVAIAELAATVMVTAADARVSFFPRGRREAHTRRVGARGQQRTVARLRARLAGRGGADQQIRVARVVDLRTRAAVRRGGGEEIHAGTTGGGVVTTRPRGQRHLETRRRRLHALRRVESDARPPATRTEVIAESVRGEARKLVHRNRRVRRGARRGRRRAPPHAPAPRATTTRAEACLALLTISKGSSSSLFDATSCSTNRGFRRSRAPLALSRAPPTSCRSCSATGAP